jgi:hypothetical protein
MPTMTLFSASWRRSWPLLPALHWRRAANPTVGKAEVIPMFSLVNGPHKKDTDLEAAWFAGGALVDLMPYTGEWAN